MTYREKIQLMIRHIDTIHDESEGMRDLATQDEQEFWNELRAILPKAISTLTKLDNSMTQEQANRKIYL